MVFFFLCESSFLYARYYCHDTSWRFFPIPVTLLRLDRNIQNLLTIPALLGVIMDNMPVGSQLARLVYCKVLHHVDVRTLVIVSVHHADLAGCQHRVYLSFVFKVNIKKVQVNCMTFLT